MGSNDAGVSHHKHLMHKVPKSSKKSNEPLPAWPFDNLVRTSAVLGTASQNISILMSPAVVRSVTDIVKAVWLHGTGTILAAKHTRSPAKAMIGKWLYPDD